VYATSHLFFCCILFIYGILVGHDLSMRILYRFHGWLIFARVIALFMFVWSYPPLCEWGYNYLWLRRNGRYIFPIILKMIWNMHVRKVWRYVRGVQPYCVRILSFVFCRILFIFGILVGHDLSMRILYRFYGWLILSRVIAFVLPAMCVRTYVQTNMKRTITPRKNQPSVKSV
jgi:hypothetical protein